jgi:hypothetical protein
MINTFSTNDIARSKQSRLILKLSTFIVFISPFSLNGNIRLPAYNPYWSFLRSHMPQHISKRDQVRDVILIRLIELYNVGEKSKLHTLSLHFAVTEDIQI